MANPIAPLPDAAKPWLAIIGIGEDGALGAAAQAALDGAEAVFGGPRHLALAGVDGTPWPIPFSIAPVLALRGRPVAVLVSGDPFWHGAGATLAAALPRAAWCALPAPGTFSLAAAALGWRIEDTLCLGLHAAPFERLRPLLAPGIRALCLLRDGAAPAALAQWLTGAGWGSSTLWILESLGGPRARIRSCTASDGAPAAQAPVAVAIETHGAPGLSRASGLPDDLFDHAGQITKRPIRALTLSALAPRPGEHLWDVGAGSGSVSVEWLLAAPGSTATAIEPRPDRIAQIHANAARFGVAHRLTVIEGTAPDALPDGTPPSAVFLGGGGPDIMDALWSALPAGVRFVANAVTLASEAALIAHHARHGGTLHRFSIAQAAPLGPGHGWDSARPITQWSTTR